ncbi:alpha/beta hydrolase fold domain-containing protein [Massilia dura]|uniref:Alpha/beta hydrolase fold domain-containing protein n=1 Tax=Pseudoduganella dura TaxID=321982 RepID=A0A6I3XCM5_9BURK|nr:alpha/beta hydrolase [Pseudoduganella dura]MUI11291.1 alpha/beta hydrolase fold domain-containing protein [Pseudoduganella dura]GGY20230.1 endo-1,4-beta-xylanase [Pseudoduganella dura]
MPKQAGFAALPAFALVFAVLACPAAPAQEAAIPLWPDGAPGAGKRHGEPETVKEGVYFSNVHDPSLTVMRADPRHANGAAVIVVPGGGHRMLVFQNEGVAAAKNLNRIGVTAFVLKYRLAREEGSGYTIEGDAAADLRRAVRWVRTHAAGYGVDPARIGAMGFSAGGELVSLVADNPPPPGFVPRDAVDSASARPDFQVLVYPGPLGVPAGAAGQAPPAFLVAGSRDACCMPPTLALYQQLVAAGVSAELHLYADTDHAFNVGQRGERVSLQHWPDRLSDWLADGGWLVARDGRPGRPPEGVPAP